MGEREDVNALASAIGADVKARTLDLRTGQRLGSTAASVADWNLAVTNGWYSAPANAANSPVAELTMGEVTVFDANWIRQTVWQFSTNTVANPKRWIRERNAATWGAWRPDIHQQGLDRPGGFQPEGTRRAAFNFGASGWSSVTGTTLNAATQRVPFILPVATTRWRVRISNKRIQDNVSTGTGAVSFTGLGIGEAFKQASDGEFASGWMGAVTAVGGAFTVPAAGAEYVSPWFTAANQQMSKPGTTYMLSMAWTKASTTIYSGSMGGFTSTSTADLLTGTPTMTYNQQTYFNIQIEYDFVGVERVLLAIGDSLTESFGPKYAFGTWHQRLSRRLGIPVIGAGVGGATARDWASTLLTDTRWDRIIAPGFNIDASIVLLGTNDVNEATPRTLAQYTADMITINARLRNNVLSRDNYCCTIPPRGLTAASTQENLRIAYNLWLIQGRHYYNDTFDIATQLEAAQGNVNLRTQYRSYQFGGDLGTANTDAVHWSDWGHARAADAIQISTA